MALMQTPVCDFDKPAPSFDLINVLDKEQWDLARVAGERGTLILFICNHCPYVKAIIEHLVADIKQLQADGIGVAAIMSNDVATHPEDSPENMKEFAVAHGFSFPYLYDETQSIAKAYDAVCTPDFFGYNQDLGLQYRGRYSSGGKDAPKTEQAHELLIAMQQIANTGHGPSEQTPSMGCSIKWR